MIGVWVIVLLVLGIAGLIESLTIMSFPTWSLRVCKKMGFGKLAKNEKRLKKIATWELIIAIILLIIAINL